MLTLPNIYQQVEILDGENLYQAAVLINDW